MRQRAVQWLPGLAAGLFLLACTTASRQVPRGALEASEAARRAIAQEGTLDAAALPMLSVGVVPMDVGAGDTLLAPLSYGLADLLITDLARSGQLRVVDRMRMAAILRELDLAASGRVDTTQAPRVGRLMGARQLVIGSLLQAPENQLSIDTRIADVATTEVTQAVSARAPLVDILDAEKALVLRIFAQLGVTLTPAERAAVDQRPTRNLAALLAYSRGVRHEVYGRYGQARTEYATAVRFDPGFSTARGRLDDLGGSAAGSASVPTTSIRRAAMAATDAVNPALIARVGGAADPAFSGGQIVTLVITITTPP